MRNGLSRAAAQRRRPAFSFRFFEWPQAATYTPWLWVFLGAAVLIPFPAFGWPLPERGVPIMWLMLGGVAVLLSRIAPVSWPCATLLGWAVLRAAYHAFPLRSLQVLALMFMGAMLYVLARHLPDGIARRAAWAFLIGTGFQAGLGLLNTQGIYPWMIWVQPEQIGKPMGFLTHPNYWGSMMAMSLPLVWALCGVPAAVLLGILILRTISGGPVITAAVAGLVMAWPLFTRRARYLVASAGAAAVAVTMTLHEWRLSGRREVWLAAWPEIRHWPFLGEGIGQWRSWADDFNTARLNSALSAWSQAHGGAQPDPATVGQLQTSTFFATLQAHSEPYQLWFELGLIGVAIGLCWVIQAAMSAWIVWKAAPASKLPGPWWRWGRAPLERAWIGVLAAGLVNMFGSPTFHLPAQAAIMLFAVARIQSDAHALSAGVPAWAPAERMDEYAETGDRN